MTHSNFPIVKSIGVTPTERLLAELCDRTFLKLWSYPNPFKEDGKELCDVLVVFGNHVLIFFDRESRKFDGANKDTLVSWQRWRREAIDKQIATAKGAERYLRSRRGVFLDEKCSVPFPIPIPSNATIHRVIVAHGAAEACAAFSDQNVYGSLAISYGDRKPDGSYPFMIHLDRSDVVHLLDSHNLEILFGTLDTVYDFTSYLAEKERAIGRYFGLMYCGEEDLLANYLLGYDVSENQYRLGCSDRLDQDDINFLMIGEGEWKDFAASSPYQRRIDANRHSYAWDRLIQKTCQNALDGTILGDANLMRGPSALHEMAREPRFSRRALSEAMLTSIHNFPETDAPLVRNISFMPSFYKDVGYVFLQLKAVEKGDYDSVYRPRRQVMLEIACGAARNKFSHLRKVIGIAIDTPKYPGSNAEDFALLDCSDWSEERAAYYREANKGFEFFDSASLQQIKRRVTDFPTAEEMPKRPPRKPGRNEPCPSGSGQKYKRCCLT